MRVKVKEVQSERSWEDRSNRVLEAVLKILAFTLNEMGN